MVWAFQTSSTILMTHVLQKDCTSSNKTTPPSPSQTLHQLGSKHSNISAILIQITTIFKIVVKIKLEGIQNKGLADISVGKVLLCKHEQLCLDPSIHVKGQVQWHHWEKIEDRRISAVDQPVNLSRTEEDKNAHLLQSQAFI